MKSFIITLLALMTFSAFANYKCSYKVIDFRSDHQPELEFNSVDPIALQVNNGAQIIQHIVNNNNYELTLSMNNDSRFNNVNYSLSHNDKIVVKGSNTYVYNQNYLSFEVESYRYFLMVSCQKVD